MALGDYYGITHEMMGVFSTKEDYQRDIAEDTVYQRVERMGIDTESFSDTGTVDNLILAGYTMEQVMNGDFTTADLADNISIIY